LTCLSHPNRNFGGKKKERCPALLIFIELKLLGTPESLAVIQGYILKVGAEAFAEDKIDSLTGINNFITGFG
jgi:hypothetical protein